MCGTEFNKIKGQWRVTEFNKIKGVRYNTECVSDSVEGSPAHELQS